MRLLVDCHVFDGAFQGTRTYLEGLYTHMTQYKDIDFFFSAQNIAQLKSIFGEGENIHYIQLESSNKWKRLAVDYSTIIKDNQIDYAHYQYISPLRKCCREIVTLHDLLFMDFPNFFTFRYKFPKRILFKRSAKRADILLTVSEYSKESIAKHFNIDKNRIYITYNSILPAENAGLNIDIKSKYGFDKYILTVSRIEPRKNHLALLKAYDELRLEQMGYHLVMVGTKDLAYKDLFTYYDNLNESVKSKVHFMKVDFDDLVALYRQADLFVFPSFGEGFGIPPLESLAYGCPLLCSNATAMNEFNLPEEITFNPYNESELKSKIINQLKKPSDLSIVREEVLAKYNWKQIARAYYAVLVNKS